MELNAVLVGIKQLLSPPREGTILQSLEDNLDSFEAFLQDPSQAALKEAFRLTFVSLHIPESREDCVILYCRFIAQALALLRMLDESLKRAHAEDLKQLKETPSAAKTSPAPKALLSPTEEKGITTLLQFVVSLGIFPFLLPGADNLLHLKLGEMASQLHKSCSLLTTKACYLYHSSNTLSLMFTTPVIGANILSCHLSDVLAALLQICHGPKDTTVVDDQTYPILSEVQRQWCTEKLTDLLSTLHQPLVVRELLSLQSAPRKSADMNKGSHSGRVVVTPKWLRSACGRLLSERLMQEDGVHKVLLGIFDAIQGGEGVGDWKKVQAVARIISSCPSQASSLSHYYATISPQLLRLLKSPMAVTVQVAAATVSLMMKQQPALARTHLLDPLTQPLKLLTTTAFTEGQLPESLGCDVQESLSTLLRLCDAVDSSSPIVIAIQPFLPVIFELWKASIESVNTSDPLRSKVKDLLVNVINSMDSTSVILFLRHVSGMSPLSGGTVEWIAVSPCFSIEWPSEKGKVLRVRCVGDGGEGRWSVEKMERLGQTILELVGTEIKSRQLLGQFFVECLTCIAATLCLGVGYQTHLPSVQREMKQMKTTRKPSDGASSVLLDVEQRMAKPSSTEAFHHSLWLYLTAALSENKTSEVLEQTDTSQLLNVLSVVVECHAHLVTRKQGNPSSSSSPPNLLVIQPNLDQMLGGPITLSIALGYLSALLGGARQVEKEHRPLLSGLLQPLETISTGYPEPDLSVLACDLRVCIATLGAVWSAEMRGAAQGGRGGMTSKVLAGFQQASGNDRLETLSEMSQQTTTGRGLEIGRHCPQEGQGSRLIEEISEPPPSQSKHQRKEEPGTPFQRALKETQDLEVPVKGHGLASLARLIEAKDKEVEDKSLFLFGVFRDNLHHPDSYVYLAAIRGLVSLASAQPLKVLALLCDKYALFIKSCSSRKVDKETGEYQTGSKQEEHLKQSRRKDSEANTGEKSLEFRLKVGEALVRAARDCGQMLPHYADMLLAAVLSNSRDPHPLIRASSLSNLAEICQLLGHSFGTIHHEVLSCVSQILLSDPTPQVQQAALLVLSLLLKGLSHNVISVLGDSLHDIYRLLKRVEGERERDDLTRAHARAALGELDCIMRDWAFPPQTFSKNITIH